MGLLLKHMGHAALKPSAPPGDCGTLTGVGISSPKSPAHPGGTRLGSPCLRASYGHTEKKAAALAAQRRAAASAGECAVST